MPKPLWMISYDIACPKRLRKIQYYCASQGWQLQKSLYLFALTKSERQVFCDDLLAMTQPKEDKILCLPFDVVEGSFHMAPPSPLLLIHDDPRLDGFVF